MHGLSVLGCFAILGGGESGMGGAAQENPVTFQRLQPDVVRVTPLCGSRDDVSKARWGRVVASY